MNSELKKKIGQLIISGFPSPFVDEHARSLIEDYGVSNFVLFTRNIVSPTQVVDMCNELNALVLENGTGFAPLIGVDQEGGMVSRIRFNAMFFPGAMAVAASRKDVTYELGLRCGKALRALGINSNFAPVLDVNTSPMNPIIGTRAYSDNPEHVTKLGIDMMHGLTDANVLSVVKHYPGHGDVSADSHLIIPKDKTKYEVLKDIQWLPFQKAFDAGADALMTAHVCFTSIDDNNPATLSTIIMRDILRKNMNFNGVVLSDCLEMNAIKDFFGIGEGAVMAIEAGCDFILISHTMEAVDEAVRGIYDGIKSGRISEKRLDESLKRIASIKRKYDLIGNQHIDGMRAEELCTDAQTEKMYKDISETSITLISKSGIGPEAIKFGKKAFFSPAPSASTGVEDQKYKMCFSLKCAEYFDGMGVVVPIDGVDETTETMLNADFDVAVLGLYNARFRQGQIELLRRLEALNKPLIVVLLGAPYDATLIQRAEAVIAAYEYTPLSVNAVIKALKKGSFPGILPVELKCR